MPSQFEWDEEKDRGNRLTGPVPSGLSHLPDV